MKTLKLFQILIGLFLVLVGSGIIVGFYFQNQTTGSLIERIESISIDSPEKEVGEKGQETFQVVVVNVFDQISIFVRTNLTDITIEQVDNSIKVRDRRIDVTGYDLITQQSDFYGTDVIVKIELVKAPTTLK